MTVAPLTGLHAPRLSCRRRSCAAQLIRRRGDVVQLNTRPTDTESQPRRSHALVLRAFYVSCMPPAARSLQVFLSRRSDSTHATPAAAAAAAAVRNQINFSFPPAHCAARRRSQAWFSSCAGVSDVMNDACWRRQTTPTDQSRHPVGGTRRSWWTTLWTLMPEARCGLCQRRCCGQAPQARPVRRCGRDKLEQCVRLTLTASAVYEHRTRRGERKTVGWRSMQFIVRRW